MSQQAVRGKKVLIMGLGFNGGGAGVARFFLRMGADVTVTDLKTKKELRLTVKELNAYRVSCGKKCGKLEYHLGGHQKTDFKNHSLIIQGPGVPNISPFLAYARKNKIPIDTDIGIFFEKCPAPIIGITGSKGKSTTATLIYNILKQKFRDVILAGNIGKSALDYIDRIKPTTKVVLELSSWQLEGLSRHKKSPHIAVITNILKEHLNRYKNFRAYARSKALIFKYQKRGDYLVISRQAAKILRMVASRPARRIILFPKNIIVRASPSQTWVSRELYYTDSSGKFAGTHNRQNLEMAYIVGNKICGISENLIKKAIPAFKGLPGRQERVAQINGVSYYNDTTATMPDAAVVALKSIKPAVGGKVILIAGGTDKKLDFCELAREIKKRVGVLILLPGDATEKLKRFFAPLRMTNRMPVFNTSSMKEAAKLAYKNSQKGDAIILSPGAASFGLFKNEFDRGEQFVREVIKLKYKT